MKLKILTLFLCLFSCILFCQRDVASEIWLNPTNTDFKTIQNNVEAFFEGKDKGRGSGYKQWKQWEHLNKLHLDSEGRIINFSNRISKENKKYHKAHPELSTSLSRSNTGDWTILSPTDGYQISGSDGNNPGLGRVNVIAFAPNSSNTIYAGTPLSGLWRTTNGGLSWACLTDQLPLIGVSGIVVHPTNANIIYILTGDGDAGTTRCTGVLKSFDGGNTWQQTGLQFDIIARGYKLLMHPTSPNILFAITNQGIFKTVNSGGNWVEVVDGSFRDMEFKPDTPSTTYAVTTNRFYKSIDTGESWTSLPSAEPTTGEARIALAVSAANPNCVYYFAGASTSPGTYIGLYRSNNSGDTWTLRHNAPNLFNQSVGGTGQNTQATYDIAIAVDPMDDSNVITGGINLWRSTNWGNLFTIASHWNVGVTQSNNLEYVHADIHDLVYNPFDNALWCANDGGVFKSTDNGATWEDRSSFGFSNGLQIMQFYKIAATDANPNIIIGGTQDNGSNRWQGTNDIYHFLQADGGGCVISQEDEKVQYATMQQGTLFKSINGGVENTNVSPTNVAGAFITPVGMDPNDSDEIWIGIGNLIYRSIDAGSTWTSSNLGSSDIFSDIHHSHANSQRIYITRDNDIFVSENNGSTWTNILGNIPVTLSSKITGVSTDVNNANQVWVTLGSFTNGEKVFYNSNGGEGDWENISGSLPNVPVYCIEYDRSDSPDNGVYIGTSLGVFYRNGSMDDWIPFRNGMPIVPIYDLAISMTSETTGFLRAGTFGRGLWSTDLFENCPTEYVFTNPSDPALNVGYNYYQASNRITSTAPISGGQGTEVYFKANNYIDLLEGFNVDQSIKNFRAWNGPCGGGDPNDSGH